MSYWLQDYNVSGCHASMKDGEIWRVMAWNEEMLLSSYDYDLPEAQIAQYPHRGESRLLLMDRADGALEDALFADLAKYLPPEALLIANNSRVVPARIRTSRKTGGKLEFLCLTSLPLAIASKRRIGTESFCAEIDCLLRPINKIKIHEQIDLCPGLCGTLLAKGEFGQARMEIRWEGDLEKIFERHGSLPLPPYIRRPDEESDQRAYQTMYASIPGSVAAPTAGLHFSVEQINELEKSGRQWREVTLHVGYGTFNPVRTDNIADHKMHAEFVEIPADTSQAINEAKKDKRPVIAVGTTSLRTLEGVFEKEKKIAAWQGLINIFIYPGYGFNVVDGLITNFHLPKSTLLMLVSAFAGRRQILNAYHHAIKKGYRFFSYGDAMLII